MHCDRIHPKLTGYLENELSPIERVFVESHLAHCYLCKEKLEEQKALNEAARGAVRHPAPRYRFAELEREIARAEGDAVPIPLHNSLTSRYLWKAAASLLAVFVLGVAAYGPGGVQPALETLDALPSASPGTEVGYFSVPMRRQFMQHASNIHYRLGLLAMDDGLGQPPAIEAEMVPVEPEEDATLQTRLMFRPDRNVRLA